MLFIKKYYLEICSLFIFLSTAFLYQNINFIQNDEWVYYQNIENILQGDFKLHPKTAPTFYTVGFLAALWSLTFSFSSLPILTLLVSLFCFYFFVKILELKFKFSKFTNILLGLILATNILFSYSSIGFMTENYLIFFLLVSIYFFEKYEKSSTKKFLHLSNIFSVVTFFVKQTGIVFLIATSIYYLLKKQYSDFKIQLVYLASLLCFYWFLFPKTQEIIKKDLALENFSSPIYIFSLFIGILLYLVFFTIPLILIFIKNNYLTFKISLRYLIILFTILISSFLVYNNFFKPQSLSNAEFPYFKNIFQRTGFFPKNINGTKYQFKFNYDLFILSDYLSKFLLLLSIPVIFFKLKNLINVYSISLFGFVVLMFLTNPFYDRYLLYTLPFVILTLAFYIKDNLFEKILITGFILFQFLLSYLFVNDYIITHRYLWDRALELKQNTQGSKLLVTDSWGSLNGRDPYFFKYIFSFDTYVDNPIFKSEYKLIESYEITFWGNLFIKPEIYLYERIQN